MPPPLEPGLEPPPHHAAVGRALLAAHLVLSPLVFCTAIPDPFETPKFLLMTATAVALAALTGSAWLQRPWRLRLRPDAAAVGALVFLASAVVSTVASVSPHTSWRGAPESCAGLQTVLGYAALYFGVR